MSLPTSYSDRLTIARNLSLPGRIRAVQNVKIEAIRQSYLVPFQV
jgi:hypothetical protein